MEETGEAGAPSKKGFVALLPSPGPTGLEAPKPGCLIYNGYCSAIIALRQLCCGSDGKAQFNCVTNRAVEGSW